MIELENAQIESVEELGGSYAKYEASPLPAGYGVTLGNALRRVMLSSLEGAAVTSIISAVGFYLATYRMFGAVDFRRTPGIDSKVSPRKRR